MIAAIPNASLFMDLTRSHVLRRIFLSIPSLFRCCQGQIGGDKAAIVRQTIRQIRQNLMIAFVVLALAVRVLVPTGWMPSSLGGHPGFALCTGQGLVEAWVDSDGKLHKSPLDKREKGSNPCLFSGLTAGIDPAILYTEVASADFAARATQPLVFSLGIGRGLAAPPPPSTGPPFLI